MTKLRMWLVRTALIGSFAVGLGVMPAASVQANEDASTAHMRMTALRAKEPGDQARADAIVADARAVAEKYRDYHKALADGFVIFMPDQKQGVYHFVRDFGDGIFDPKQPPALLYERTAAPAGGSPGYKLVGVMYTARFGASEPELDRRIPLSIAQWHEHLKLCVPADAGQRDWLTGDPRFGLSGSIDTAEACRAAGGRFMPHLSGWMTHVYPFEQDPAKVWHAGMGDEHNAMPGMKM